MHTKVLLTFYFFIFPFLLFAQQERTVFLYNLGFGGITAGIGAVINKPKDVNWKNAILKGFWQGSVGGVLNYAGRKQLTW